MLKFATLARHLGRAFTLLALLALPLLPATAQDDDGLLDVTQAFRLDVQATESGTLKLHWDIAPDYYLYRGRIAVKALGEGVELGALDLPAGRQEHDPYLGDVETYRGSVDALLHYTLADPAADAIDLTVRFQGCHEVDPKICYPPYTQKVHVALPAAPAAPAIDPAASAPVGGLAAALGKIAAPTDAAPVNDEPLPPEQAFRFETIADGPGALLARFTMPDGYYLYREKSRILLADADGVELGEAEWPQAVEHTDENFGTTPVYFHEVDIPIPLLRRNTAAQDITVHAEFQGCQDGGICYPVMTRDVTVALPAGEGKASRAAAVTPTASADLSDEQRLAQGLLGSSRWATLLAFFGFGLLLAFTPCVLPMVPILSGLIAGAGKDVSTRRAFVLSLVYVLASCVVFTIAGIVAGLVGANLQAAFQTPWVLWAFALLFVLLALSMFGFYELQLPPALQNRLTGLSNRQKSGSLAGVAVMGVLSALIVGPCVAPPLAAAVLYIAENQDPVFGGLALFLLSLGMGVPLIAFGTVAGKLVPRAGAWMVAVKNVFGVLFLALAIWMLSRILAPFWILLMTGTLLLACAVYVGALERLPDGASGWRRLWKTLGILALVVGIAQLVGALAGSRSLLQPLSGFGGGSSATAADTALPFQAIKTTAQLDAAIDAAAGRTVMLDFYADWCVSCKEMEARTFNQPEVHQALADVVLLKADVTANDDDDQALMKRFGLFGPPATIFFGADGQERRALRLIGFENADGFVARVARAGTP